MTRAAALALVALTLAACGRDTSGSVDATLAAFVPSGETVHETHRAVFELDGRDVALTHVEYGSLMDCAAGCFAAHVCAIEDGDTTSLFYASWNTESETPTGIAEVCPGLEYTETWPDCMPPGLTHPVTATAEFSDFVREEVGSGPLRFCVNRYGDRF